MRLLLGAFVVILALAIYPIFEIIPIELQSFWGIAAFDFFSWYRMFVLGIVGIVGLTQIKKDWRVLIYAALLLISFFRSDSHFALTGTPQYHEGLIALLGYCGIYLLSVRVGLTEIALRIVIWLCLALSPLQLFLKMCEVKWPLYSIYGNPNHLGLFCALFLPFCFVRKLWWECGALYLMLLCTECRASLIAVGAILFMTQRRFVWIALAACLIVIPFQPSLVRHSLYDGQYFGTSRMLGGRLELWKRELPLLKRDILIGDGPGTFPMLIKQDDFFGIHVVADRPHNLYLNIWQTSGLLSLLVLAWIVLANIKNSRDNSLRLGATAYLINSIFTDSVLGVTPYFLIFLGAMAHEYNEEKRHRSRVAAGQSNYDQPTNEPLSTIG